MERARSCISAASMQKHPNPRLRWPDELSPSLCARLARPRLTRLARLAGCRSRHCPVAGSVSGDARWFGGASFVAITCAPPSAPPCLACPALDPARGVGVCPLLWHWPGLWCGRLACARKFPSVAGRLQKRAPFDLGDIVICSCPSPNATLPPYPPPPHKIHNFHRPPDDRPSLSTITAHFLADTRLDSRQLFATPSINCAPLRRRAYQSDP